MNTDELFPGFKVSPTDPSRDIRPTITRCPEPEGDTDPLDDSDCDDYDGEATCQACNGWGHFDCFCGGDLCVCEYNGERPCWECT